MADVKIVIKGDEANAVRAFLKVVDAQKKVERGARKVTGETKRSSGEFKSLGTTAAGALQGMVMGLATVGTAIMAVRAEWRMHEQDIRDSVTALKDFQNEYVNLQFMSAHFADPGFRDKMLATATQWGIKPGEVAQGRYALESMSGALDLSPEKLESYWEALLTLRKTTSADLMALVPIFTKMGKAYPDASGQELSNMTMMMLEKAAVTRPEELATYAPGMFIVGGTVGKMDMRESAALGTYLTGVTGTAAQAAQGMRTLVRKVMLEDGDDPEMLAQIAAAGWGKTSPIEGRKAIMARAGVTADDDALARLEKLAALNAEETLTAQDLKTLFGERGMQYGGQILGDFGAVRSMVEMYRATTGPEHDIAGDRLRTVMANDPTFRLTTGAAQLDARLEAAKMDPDKAVWGNLDTAVDIMRLEQGKGWAWRQGRKVNILAAKIRGSVMGDAGASAESMAAEIARGVGYSEDEAQRFADMVRGLNLAAEKIEAAADKLNNAAGNLEATTETLPAVNAQAE